MKRRLVLFGIAILVTSCATAYRKVGLTGGFSETQLSENVFQVSFRGNGYTSRERASDFALLRSSELSLLNGYRYFIIIEAGQSSSLSSIYDTQDFYDNSQRVCKWKLCKRDRHHLYDWRTDLPYFETKSL